MVEPHTGGATPASPRTGAAGPPLQLSYDESAHTVSLSPTLRPLLECPLQRKGDREQRTGVKGEQAQCQVANVRPMGLSSLGAGEEVGATAEGLSQGPTQTPAGRGPSLWVA